MKHLALVIIALISCIDACASKSSGPTPAVTPKATDIPIWYPEIKSNTSVEDINKAREAAYLDYMNKPENVRKPKTVIVGSGRGDGYAKQYYDDKANDLLLIDVDKEVSPDVLLDIVNLNKLSPNTFNYVIFECIPGGSIYFKNSINGALNILKPGGKLILDFPLFSTNTQLVQFLLKHQYSQPPLKRMNKKLSNGDYFDGYCITPTKDSTYANRFKELYQRLLNNKLTDADKTLLIETGILTSSSPTEESRKEARKNLAYAYALTYWDPNNYKWTQPLYFLNAGTGIIQEILEAIGIDVKKISITFEDLKEPSDMYPKKAPTSFPAFKLIITKK